MSDDAELKAIVDRVVKRARTETATANPTFVAGEDLRHGFVYVRDGKVYQWPPYAHNRHGQCIDPMCPDFGAEHGHRANDQPPHPFLRPSTADAVQALKDAARETREGRFVERVVCYVLDTLTRVVDWFTRKIQR